MIIDPKKTFFCTSPWNEIYQHLDNVNPCHTNRNELGLTPSEYIQSDFLKSIKKDFVEGRVPPSCHMCKQREDIGIKSTRQSVMKSQEFYNSEDYTVDTPTVVKRLELRTSNLCNFKCRMCDSFSSSEIAKENKQYPNLLGQYSGGSTINSTHEASIEELKKMSLESVRDLCLTGGEPMLIKQYNEFLDFLIERGFNKKITVELFTNCSVYNSIFIERLKQFKSVRFVMSIDGIGKTAEYQRKGTDWSVVEKNIYRFTEMPAPFDIFFNTAISPYVLLDVSSLATFLMKLYEINDSIKTKCYSTVAPTALHFLNMDLESRARAVEQINKAVDILTADNFYILKKELLDIKRNIINSQPKDPIQFIRYTKTLDFVRKEKFEDVFGFDLKIPS